MKKYCLELTAVSLISMSANVMATTSTAAPEDGYYTKTPPTTLAKSEKVVKDPGIWPHRPTDITIVNASSNWLNFEVLQMNTERVLLRDSFPNGKDNSHVHHADGSFNTKIIVKDPNDNQIFKGVFCPFAIITVRGYPGSYSINVDDDLCKPR